MEIPQTILPDYSAAASSVRLPVEMAGMRLDAALAKVFPQHSRSRLQTWLKSGVLRVGALPADAACKVRGGEPILFAQPVTGDDTAATLLPCAENIAIDIVHEDAHILVLNKPAGWVVHPGAGNRSGTLMNALLHHAPALAEIPRAGIVHRLDKDTSGLLVVAKTLTAQTHLVRQLQAHSVRRHYFALACGVILRHGVVDAPIGRHPVQRTKMAIARTGGGRPARTHYFVLERFAAATRLECRLETGRTHQIRVHMASLGHPLLGDAVYGRKLGSELACPRQALHAGYLALQHPQTEIEMAWEAPLPADLLTVLQRLRTTNQHA